MVRGSHLRQRNVRSATGRALSGRREAQRWIPAGPGPPHRRVQRWHRGLAFGRLSVNTAMPANGLKHNTQQNGTLQLIGKDHAHGSNSLTNPSFPVYYLQSRWTRHNSLMIHAYSWTWWGISPRFWTSLKSQKKSILTNHFPKRQPREIWHILQVLLK